jgi:hypothetical protein
MAEALAQTPESLISVPEYLQPPRLGVIQVLAFLALAAALILPNALSHYYGKDTAVPNVPPGTQVVWAGLQINLNLCKAASLVGLGVLIVCKFRRIPGRLQPGHWVLLIQSIAMIWGLLWEKTSYLWFGSMSDLNKFQSMIKLQSILTGCEMLLLVAAYVLLICYLREIVPWKVFFGSIAFSYTAYGFFFFSQGIRDLTPHFFVFTMISLTVLVLLVLIVTIAFDRKNYIIRDWLHWLGLFLIGYQLALSIFQTIRLVLVYGF